jgi:glyoxylase-like metal-dependent hydrolase (beta-lactamase superfamily II)
MAGVLDFALLRAARARAQSAGAPTRLFDIDRVAEGVYLALAHPAAVLNSNAAIFVNSEDVLVVDTHSRPSAAAALVAQIREQITEKPVRFVVNTHFHYDHSQGTRAYRLLEKPPLVIGTPWTREALRRDGAGIVSNAVSNALQSAEQHRRRLPSASPEEQRYLQRAIEDLEGFAHEMKGYEPVLPDISFTHDMVIHDRAGDLHLVFRGRGHTAGDLCVFHEPSKTLATGDLVVGFVPGMADGYPMEWPQTLGRLAELPFQSVLPGHGPVQPTRARFHQQKAYIEELCERARAARAAGRSLEAAQREITPATLRSFQSGAFGDYLAASEARYRLRPSGANIGEQIAAAVRANVAAAYRAAG